MSSSASMEDRLSALPDEVILHLLTFLPPKISMQTSILAKEWRFRWKHVHCFVATTNITDEVMSQNLSNTFFIGPGTSNHKFQSWVSSVVARNPLNLVLELNHRLALPRSLFTCKTLLYLRIVDGGKIYDVGSIYFPTLKKLELVNVGYGWQSTLSHLLSGCPVLEELTVEMMNQELSFVPSCLIFYQFNVAKYPWSVIDFVSKMYNVKRLTLSTRPLNISTPYYSKLDGVKFHNLTELNLRADWRFITHFLENADNLRVLTILNMVGPVDPSSHWIEPKPVPACFVSHLKTVNLIDFGWRKRHEFDMVKYILKNAKVLKRMKIEYIPNYPRNFKLEAIKKFEMLEIESRKCKLMCY